MRSLLCRGCIQQISSSVSRASAATADGQPSNRCYGTQQALNGGAALACVRGVSDRSNVCAVRASGKECGVWWDTSLVIVSVLSSDVWHHA